MHGKMSNSLPTTTTALALAAAALAASLATAAVVAAQPAAITPAQPAALALATSAHRTVAPYLAHAGVPSRGGSERYQWCGWAAPANACHCLLHDRAGHV